MTSSELSSIASKARSLSSRSGTQGLQLQGEMSGNSVVKHRDFKKLADDFEALAKLVHKLAEHLAETAIE